MAKHFKIESTVIKNPTTFKVERYNVTDMQRLANGSMSGDLIAQKRKFYFTYDAMTGDELDTIIKAIYDSKKIFFTLTYPYNGTTKTCTVYVGSIPSELHKAGKNWVWKNVQFNLIEK